MTTCALSRGDSIGTVLFVWQTQRHVEVQSDKAQAMAFQSVWVITPHQVVKPGVILAEGAGATAYVLLEGEDARFPRLSEILVMACYPMLQV